MNDCHSHIAYSKSSRVKLSGSSKILENSENFTLWKFLAKRYYPYYINNHNCCSEAILKVVQYIIVDVVHCQMNNPIGCSDNYLSYDVLWERNIMQTLQTGAFEPQTRVALMHLSLQWGPRKRPDYKKVVPLYMSYVLCVYIPTKCVHRYRLKSLSTHLRYVTNDDRVDCLSGNPTSFERRTRCHSTELRSSNTFQLAAIGTKGCSLGCHDEHRTTRHVESVFLFEKKCTWH